MTRKSKLGLLFVLLAIFWLTVGTIAARELDVYTNPGGNGTENTNPPYGGGSGWTQIPSGGSISVPPRGSIYIACRNLLWEPNKKWFKMVLTGANVSGLSETTEGYKTNNTSSKSKKRTVGHGSGGGTMTFEYRFDPQPQWERVKLTNNTARPITVQVKAWSKCGKNYRSAGEYVSMRAYHNAIGAVTGPSDVRQIYIFPHTVPVNISIPAYFYSYNGGLWNYQWVYTDPLGGVRPLGGILFSALSYGLGTGEEYDAEFSMMDNADVMYDVFSFDYVTGQYQVYTEDISHFTLLPDPTYGDGDVNRDNIVNGIDLATANANLGNNEAAWHQGDMDGDHDVDADDISIINLNMGRVY